MTRPAPYHTRPMGPGTPGVAWDAKAFEVGPLRYWGAWVNGTDTMKRGAQWWIIAHADRVARRLARRKR